MSKRTLSAPWLGLAALIIALTALPTAAVAQSQIPSSSSALAPSSASIRLANAALRSAAEAASWTAGLPLRCVGPTVMSGRVVDLAVNPEDPSEFLVAYASGGLWHTTDHGTSFAPLFDRELVMTLGAVTVEWSTRTLWVGTGEVNSSRSSYAGLGVYSSVDWGQSWVHRGLSESHHIGRICMDPNQSGTVYVAALGPLYTEGRGDRGVFKSEDGGATWKQLLGPGSDENGAGAVDLIVDKQRPGHLIASLWDRSRRAWDFREDGPASGVFESIDDGANWTALCSSEQGFPGPQGVGRIGITYHAEADRLYVLVDNQNQRPNKPEEKTEGGSDPAASSLAPLEADDFLKMSSNAFSRLDSAQLAKYLSDHDFPEEADVENVKQRVAEKTLEPSDFYDYLSDANADLFDTPIVGSEVYVLDRNSGTWSRTHSDWLEGVCYTYCYYFGVIEVDPNDPDRLVIAGVPLLESTDAGKNWHSIAQANVHVDHHALWINPKRPAHLISGNDGGVNVSWNGGADWTQCNAPAVGQFYTVAVDEAEPYRIYGGLQDNGTWVGPNRYEPSRRWLKSGHYPYESLGGGDGMRVQVDTRTNDVVYTGSQFGWYTRTDRESGERAWLHPKHELGERPLRWNWQTPILLSKHNQDILYMGSNRVHRSLHQGEDMETLSGDLTRGAMSNGDDESRGNVPFGTLSDLDESPLRFGQLAAGSDDGRLHVSFDGGYNWDEWVLPIAQSPPLRTLWVSEVMWSAHERELLYVALNGYRLDHFESYVFCSKNGVDWTRLGAETSEGHIPNEPVNCLAQSEDREGLLFVGTDHGLYVSLDGGLQFSEAQPDLPRAPVHDLVVQERENELVIATHGRSIWVLSLGVLLDGLAEDDGLEKRELSIGELPDMEWSEQWTTPQFGWSEATDPSVDAPSFVATAGRYDLVLTHDSTGVMRMDELTLHKGFQQLTVHANFAPGQYTVRLTGADDATAGEEAVGELLIAIKP